MAAAFNKIKYMLLTREKTACLQQEYLNALNMQTGTLCVVLRKVMQRNLDLQYRLLSKNFSQYDTLIKVYVFSKRCKCVLG